MPGKPLSVEASKSWTYCKDKKTFGTSHQHDVNKNVFFLNNVRIYINGIIMANSK
jgi:hypothetical protein